MGRSTMKHLIWIDLETTGLDPDTDHILEIAAVHTDENLDIVGVFHQLINNEKYRPCVSPGICEVVQEMHSRSGLWRDRGCHNNLFLDRVERGLCSWINCRGIDKPVLAGSCPSFDREFLRRAMPEAQALLSHRHFDVSTLRIAYPSLVTPDDKENHRAIVDLFKDIEFTKKVLRRTKI